MARARRREGRGLGDRGRVRGRPGSLAPDETRAALVAAMRAGGSEREAAGWVRVLRRGQRLAVDGPAGVGLEDGTVLAVKHNLPANLPLGYHELSWPDGSHPETLIVTPRRCHLPAGLKA
ncbi:MAG: hypothetical protein HYY95_27040 [Candidatus Rokubacteria bacterium]|nr:hypothetical protein [Candidatus Rokubacteria bacterium]